MKYSAFLVCIAFLPLLAGCGDEKSETVGETASGEIVTVQGIAKVSAFSEVPGRGMLVIPASALFRRGQLEGVQVVGADSLMAIRWVRTGAETRGGVEVLSGLDEGEAVIAPHEAGVREGVRVTIKR